MPEMQKPGKMAQKRQSYFAAVGGGRVLGEMAAVEEALSETRPEGGDGETSATGAAEGMVMGGLDVSAIASVLQPEKIDAVRITLQHEISLSHARSVVSRIKHIPQAVSLKLRLPVSLEETSKL